jgi:hypothetical protein
MSRSGREVATWTWSSATRDGKRWNSRKGSRGAGRDGQPPVNGGEYFGEEGEYCGEDGEYLGEEGEYLGEEGEYCGEAGEYLGEEGE